MKTFIRFILLFVFISVPVFFANMLFSVGSEVFLITRQLALDVLSNSLLIASTAALLLTLIVSLFVAEQDRYIHVSGPKKLAGRKAIKHANNSLNVKKTSKGILVHPKIPLTKIDELGNLFIFGMQGSGKSTIIKFWLNQLMQRSVTALIYDEKREYTEQFFNEDVLLLSPGDQRSVRWHLSGDITDISSARTFADSIIHQTSDEPFWSDSARLIVTGALVCLTQRGAEWSWFELYQLLFTDMEKLQKELQQYFPEAALFADPKDRTSASVLGVISSQLGWLQYIATSESKEAAPFSIKKWLASESPKKIIIQTDSAYRSMSQALFSAALSMLTSHVLSLDDSATREVWLVLDELAAIPKNEAIEQWLSRGRSKGARTIAGTQSISQLQSIYGDKNAETMLGLFATVIVLRVGAAGQSATVASKTLGNRRVVSISTSTDENNKKSITKSEQEISVVTPEEIIHLTKPDSLGVSGYLSIAGTSAVYQLKWPFTRLNKIAQGRVQNAVNTRANQKRTLAPTRDQSKNPFIKSSN
jgi:type IV secretory pathway TraG/TraD family ATPase VirD4